MRKRLSIFAFLLCTCFLWAGCGNRITVKSPYTQEYVIGQGNIQGEVDTAAWLARDPAFEIGANANGYAVFKDPGTAFTVFAEKYADGIRLIATEWNLKPLTQRNFSDYNTYGWQVTTGTEEEREQALLVSKFLDLYENSFIH